CKRELCETGSTKGWLPIPDHDANIAARLIRTPPTYLNEGREGERSGRQLWREVRFQGYSGSERMVYRFLETLKTTEIVTSAGTHRLPQYTSNAAVWLFMRRIDAFGRAPTRRSGGFSSG